MKDPKPVARLGEGWCPVTGHPKLSASDHCDYCKARWVMDELGIRCTVRRGCKEAACPMRTEAHSAISAQLLRNNPDQQLQWVLAEAHHRAGASLCSV